MKLPTKSYAQAAQDVWALRCNHFATGGFYVDLGAYDGLESSNTAAMDFEYGWSGICVEANKQYYDRLVNNRPNSVNVHAAVCDHEGVLYFDAQWPTQDTSGTPTRCTTLQAILDENGARRTIDYMSVDIEGFEYAALSTFDFSAYRVHLLTVEHNLYCDGPFNKDRMFELLTSRGFTRVVEDAPCLGAGYEGLPFEDWFCHNDYLPNVMGAMLV